MAQSDNVSSVPALRVKQWLLEWDEVLFDESLHRREPPKHFYVTTMRASHLRALSDVHRRSTKDRTSGVSDTNSQRPHNEARSKEIAEFVRHGFPWSTLSGAQKRSGDFDDLKKPGWLPTAIVANVLTSQDERDGDRVDSGDLLGVVDGEVFSEIRLPSGLNATWRPKGVAPIEIIDGQHRLWAFNDDEDPDYELPVVFFHGLDSSWQAYLFYVINLKPTKINTSLGFDLYPLLRTEDWLDTGRADGPIIYRETRAQELTEALWSHPSSPWQGRIDMLGTEGRRFVSQAAWIRSLLQTFLKKWESNRSPVGGLYGAPAGSSQMVLPWNRAQQAAFLIHAWSQVQASIALTKSTWAMALRTETLDIDPDPAFAGPKTLANTDQGVRAILYVFNDLCYLRADDLHLRDWVATDFTERLDEGSVSEALASLSQEEGLVSYLASISDGLASYDWRTFSAPGLTMNEENLKARYRGSSGYKALRDDVLRHLSLNASIEVGSASEEALHVHGGGR